MNRFEDLQQLAGDMGAATAEIARTVDMVVASDLAMIETLKQRTKAAKERTAALIDGLNEGLAEELASIDRIAEDAKARIQYLTSPVDVVMADPHPKAQAAE